jgi:hypothetical protein
VLETGREGGAEANPKELVVVRDMINFGLSRNETSLQSTILKEASGSERNEIHTPR